MSPKDQKWKNIKKNDCAIEFIRVFKILAFQFNFSKFFSFQDFSSKNADLSKKISKEHYYSIFYGFRSYSF